MSILSFKSRAKNTYTIFTELLNYVTRADATDPALICGFSTLPADFQGTAEALAIANHQHHGKALFHIVLAFSPDEDSWVTPRDAFDVGRDIGSIFSKWNGRLMLGIMAVHLDEELPHCHYLFSNLDVYTGKRFYPDRRELADIKRSANDILKSYGLSPIKLFDSSHSAYA